MRILVFIVVVMRYVFDMLGEVGEDGKGRNVADESFR